MKALWLICLVGCALTSKATPVEIRYFSPAIAHVEPASTHVSGRVRLGRVSASSYLRYRIAHRRSPVELELSDSLRWAEQPEEYVRRSVGDALFGDRGVEQVVGGEALTLSLEVTAFEHVERAGRHYGCVELRYTLEDEQRVVASDVLAVERQAAGAEITQIVPAIADALQAASTQIAERVAVRAAATH
ncbi:MAG TPA: ABC-type transport auxiliary lipoprotein family protein [Kofleriaceae bacterium]